MMKQLYTLFILLWAAVSFGQATCFNLSEGPEFFETSSPILNSENDLWKYNPTSKQYTVNGFCGTGCTETTDSWLIFGPLNTQSINNLFLNFDSAHIFGATDLVIKYTTDYSALCPSGATWSTIDTISPPATTGTIVSNSINISSAVGEEVFIGIQYFDDDASKAQWSLSNITIETTDNSCPVLGERPTSNCGEPCGLKADDICNEICSATDGLLNLYHQNFAVKGEGYTTSIPEFIRDGVDTDYFTQTLGTDIRGTNITNIDGGYFAAQDIDGAGETLPVSLEIPNINIENVSNLEFSIDIAEDDDGSRQDWDSNDYMKIFYSVNGAPEQNLLWVSASGTTNTTPNIDNDFDGIGEGSEITNEFTKFTRNITGTGTTLSIRIEFQLNAGDEDIALDNISICGQPLEIYKETIDICSSNYTKTVFKNRYNYITNENNKVIAAINPMGNDLGNVTGSVYIRNATEMDGDETAYLNRTIFLSPENNNLPATVRYYFTQAELDALIADSKTVNTDLIDDVDTIDDLHVTQVFGAGCGATFVGDGTVKNSNGELHDKSTVTTGSDAIGLYIEFDVGQFSAFTAHGGKAELLPVELTSFTAEQENGTVALNWSTVSEKNNKEFQVLRSANGIDFEQIGTVQGKGTTTLASNYSFVDEFPLAGKNYYQLNQVDFDGTSTKSNIIYIDIEASRNAVVASNRNEITVHASTQGNVQVNIYSLQGQLIESQQIEMNQRMQTISFKQPLAIGVYIIKLEQQHNQTVIEKFIINQ